MATFFPQPISLADIEKKRAENNKVVDYSVTDWWDGFKEENLPMLIYQKMNDDSSFPAEENYVPSQDPQLKGYEEFMHHFYFSKSQAETTAMIEKLKQRHSVNKESPWYHLGRITGAFTDPSMLLLLPKAAQIGGRSTLMFGTAATAEEFAKQNLDPFREDAYVAWVAGAAYGIPFILNKLTAPPPLSVQKNVKELESQWIGKNIKDGDVAVDGTFVKPETKELAPSGVGAEGVTKPVRTTIKKEMTGEKFIETNLRIFGEDGPWTPVFRVINQKLSLTARRMMGDLLDTPLLKLKNTKAWGFSATGKSIETDMRMMRAKEIESHKLVKGQYLKYVERQQLETGASVPKTDLFMMFKNRGKDAQSKGWLNQDQFAKEVTIARLNSFDHSIPEVAEAARITQKNVYEPLFKEANLLKIRELPVESELKFWNQQLKNLRTKGEGSVSFTSKYGKKETTVYNISRIEKEIDKLTKRLERIKRGQGVKDYINIVYIKNAIDKNADHFRDIITRFYARQGIQINKADLDRLVKDLSNHFPFVKPRKGDYDAVQRYVFKDPRYARANRARELNLDKQAQLELIEAGMIMSDIFALQKIYARQMIPDILLTRKYGDPNGLGFKFIEDGEMSGFFPGLMTVANEFNMKIAMGAGKNVYYRGTGGGLFKKKFGSVGGNTGLDAAFGSGIYLTKDPKVAKSYGKNVKTHSVNINKPYKITTDNEIVELFRKAGVKDPELALQETWLKHFEALDKKIGVKEAMKNPRHYRNISPMDFQKKYQTPAFIKARKWLEANGHDALIVEIKQTGTSSIKRRFTDDQTIVFDSKNVKQINVDTRSRADIIKERDQVLGDLEAAIELIKGTYGLPANPHAWTSVAMRSMKHYNALTMLTGFFAAIPDVARITMTSGIKRGFRTQFEMFSDFLSDGKLFKMGKKEAQSFGEAVDMVTGQRAMLFADVGDMFGLANKLEGSMGKLSAFNFMYVNLMSRWTEMAKSMASVTIGSRIIEDSIKWSKAGIKPLDIKYIKIPEGKAMASFNRANNQVVMDLERIQKTFNEKAWTKPRIQGVDPLPANQFKTFDEWKDFIYFHELSHWKNPRLAGETLAAYENRMNKLALDSNNIKALKKAIETEGIAIGGLSDKWKTALASSGIDADMARRIANQFEKYGEKTKHNFMANTSQWDDVAAVDAFGAALNKDINITIVTPGLGDTPKWMSTELGSTLAQFKKFAMSSTQRMLMRGLQERDLDFMFGAMMLMGSGMLIDATYHKFRFNRDYNKLSLTQKLLNAFDRSGLAGIYTDVNKAIETLTDNRFGITPLLGERRPYGSSGRWKAGTIGGPTGGQIYNIFDIMFDVGGGKYNHHTAKNVRRLIPFQNVWYLDWLFDDIQKGLY